MTKISLAQTSVPTQSLRQINQTNPAFKSKKDNTDANQKQDKDNQILSLTLVIMSLVNMIKTLKKENQDLRKENRDLKESHKLDLAA